MPMPSADDQIRFLRNVQALLEDGQLVATYKFALLTAFADLAVESDVTDDQPLVVPVRSIAEKFIDYYWQQSAPFASGHAAQVLKQNSGRQAAVVGELVKVRGQGFASLSQFRANTAQWNSTVGRVARVVRDMPLFRLQYIGGTLRPFLYAHRLQDGAIVLNPGIAHCLRQFHALVTGLARDRWLAMVRQLRENVCLVGQSQDIERFMFGAGREPIRQHLDRLTASQHGLCLYCQRKLSREVAHVDHFVPWMLHRCDALPNLVAAHANCNLAKSDWLAAEPHLERWARRNESIESDFSGSGLAGATTQLQGVISIARWAYDRAYELGLPTWLRGNETIGLSPGYRALFGGSGA